MLLVFILSILIVIIFILVIFAKAKIYISIREDKLNASLIIKSLGIPFLKIDLVRLIEKIKRKRNERNSREDRAKRKRIEKNIVKRFSKAKSIYLKKLNLETNISTGDAILTSFLVTTLNSGIAIFFKVMGFRINSKNVKYKVYPVYSPQKVTDIYLDCILSVNLVHTIFIILSEWRCDINGRKTSNRKSYGYCNE